MTGHNASDPARRQQRERVVAWIVNGLACSYCVWIGAYLWRGASVFGKLFEGLGTRLPPATEFVVHNDVWLYPAVFGGLVVALLVKELLVRDKRLSAMLSLAGTIVAQFAAQWFLTACYLPLFDLIKDLN